MEDWNPVPVWDPPAPSESTWVDMLNDLLQDSATGDVGSAQVQTLDEGLVALVDDSFGAFTEVGGANYSDAWWSAPAVDGVLDQIDVPDLGNAFIVEGSDSLPGLISEASSLAEGGQSVPNEVKSSSDAGQKSRDVGVSSPVSCSSVEQDCAPSSNSGDDAAIVSSQSHSPIVTSCSDHGAASPDAGCDSSDAGAMGRSCDNFGEHSDIRDDKTSGDLDEDAKRQSRLMRNRESATQSRLRKKSYVKDLEAKCRAMESQMSMLHQTVAFTSAQNAALREELAHYRCLKGNGSKSGVMEPAALPSDSLPSESPSRHTTPFLSAKLELVACLCHVLLLTLFQALPLVRSAPSVGKTPNEAGSDRHYPSVAAFPVERLNEAAKQLTWRQCFSNRRRRRILSTRDDNSLLCWEDLIFPANSKFLLKISEASPFSRCKISSRRGQKRSSRRSQYCAV